jgi:hypothetical protein
MRTRTLATDAGDVPIREWCPTHSLVTDLRAEFGRTVAEWLGARWETP